MKLLAPWHGNRRSIQFFLGIRYPACPARGGARPGSPADVGGDGAAGRGQSQTGAGARRQRRLAQSPRRDPQRSRNRGGSSGVSSDPVSLWSQALAPLSPLYLWQGAASPAGLSGLPGPAGRCRFRKTLRPDARGVRARRRKSGAGAADDSTPCGGAGATTGAGESEHLSGTEHSSESGNVEQGLAHALASGLLQPRLLASGEMMMVERWRNQSLMRLVAHPMAHQNMARDQRPKGALECGVMTPPFQSTGLQQHRRESRILVCRHFSVQRRFKAASCRRTPRRPAPHRHRDMGRVVGTE